jgi:hypothetical protein
LLLSRLYILEVAWNDSRFYLKQFLLFLSMNWASACVNSVTLTMKMLFFTLLIDIFTVGALTNQPDCVFLVRNDYESPVEVNWIDPSTGRRVLMSNPYIRPGSDFTVVSYLSHKLEFKELPDTQRGKCADASTECQVAFYNVKQPEKQWLTLDRNFEFQHSDHFVNAHQEPLSIEGDCESQASIAM